jgi:hypothetical protein
VDILAIKQCNTHDELFAFQEHIWEAQAQNRKRFLLLAILPKVAFNTFNSEQHGDSNNNDYISAHYNGQKYSTGGFKQKAFNCRQLNIYRQEDADTNRINDATVINTVNNETIRSISETV